MSAQITGWLPLQKRSATLLLVSSLAIGFFVYSEISKPPLSALDLKVHDALHPKTQGLAGLGIDKELPIALEILSLPSNSSAEKMVETVNTRLKKAQAEKMNAHDEACYVLALSTSTPNSIITERTKLLDMTLDIQQAMDPKFHSGCYGITWKTPFKILRKSV